MKKSKKPIKPAKSMDVVGRADNYQVSRSLPDLRHTPPPPASPPTTIDPAAIKPIKPGRWQRFKQLRWKKIIKRTTLVLVLLLVLAGGWLGYKAVRNSGKLGTNIFSFFDNSKLKGEDRGRVNILLAGDSSDDPGHPGADLTDSVMIVSINPTNKTGFIMSIPRDLYVPIQGHGYAKINAANVYGNADKFNEAGYPNGGIGLLEKTVTAKFGIPIDYYALINYTAFRDAVNAVGGITVNIQAASKYGLYDPYTNLKLANGTQQLDGQMALNLARSRGDGPGSYGFAAADFDRTQHQRDMLFALKDKASSAGVLTNPVKIGNLFDAAGNNVKTDLSLGNIRRLNNLAKGINNADMQSVSLNSYNGKNYLKSYTSRDGQSTLVPAAGIDDYSQIQALITQLSAATPKTTAPSQ